MKLKDVPFSAKEIAEISKQYIFVPKFNYNDLVIERAQDQYLYDTDGNEYLDFYCGVAVESCGHNNPRVTKAIQEQAELVTQNAVYFSTVPSAMLAKNLCDAIGMDKLIYQNSGAESNEAMIKIARKYGIEHYGPEKYEIITAKQSFHGRTFGAMTATGQPNSSMQNHFGPLVPGFKYAEYNNLKSFEDAITENTIAIMVEPVQGEGGVRPATKGFMTGLRKLCDEKGLLLLLDEVQTGLGRTGTLMAYMGYGIKPDIVTLAKALGNGVPIGACCFTKEVGTAMQSGNGEHGSTFASNALTCAAGYAALTEIMERNLSENAAKVGDYFAEKLNTLPHKAEVRHKGLMIGLELDSDIAEDVKMACLKRGVMVCNLGDNIIRMVPPLIITEADCDKVYEALKESIEEVCA